jgi:hypothetical protein
LLDRHPDDREQRQDDDLSNGEVDLGQQAPQPAAQAGNDVEAVRPDERR